MSVEGIATVVDRGVNPKDIVGATKPDLSLLPGTAMVEWARAQADGARKYGPYNWREKGKPVQAMTYVGAAQRHLAAFVDGEDVDPVSLVLHLAHAMACCAILIDAKACGNTIDNRPTPAPTADLIRKYTTTTTKTEVRYLAEEQDFAKLGRDLKTPGEHIPKVGRKWENELETLRERVFATFPGDGTSMSTERLAQEIHDLWVRETKEITGVEPIADLLRLRQPGHPHYYRDASGLRKVWHKKPIMPAA